MVEGNWSAFVFNNSNLALSTLEIAVSTFAESVKLTIENCE